jgi:hypothetical protein
MLKAAVDGGVNYFDTAYIYHGGKSEEFTGRFLREHSGLKREEYYIATKLPIWLVDSLDDAKRIFADQCDRLGVDYIDFYMLHDLKQNRFEKMRDMGVFDFCLEMQKSGKIKHFGFSTHDNLEGFKVSLDYRDWDFVMLHLNYMDLDNLGLYDYAVAKGIPVLGMEGVKGGSLSNLPDDIRANFCSSKTPSSYALRWVGSKDIKVILSGMSSVEQVADNLATFSGFEPLTDEEHSAIKRVQFALRKRVRNNCTGCNYCMPCPMGVNIPWVLSIWNNWGIYENRGHSNWEWSMVGEDSRPPKCNKCGKCVAICPQGIDIVADLKRTQNELEAIKW